MHVPHVSETSVLRGGPDVELVKGVAVDGNVPVPARASAPLLLVKGVVAPAPVRVAHVVVIQRVVVVVGVVGRSGTVALALPQRPIAVDPPRLALFFQHEKVEAAVVGLAATLVAFRRSGRKEHGRRTKAPALASGTQQQHFVGSEHGLNPSSSQPFQEEGAPSAMSGRNP